MKNKDIYIYQKIFINKDSQKLDEEIQDFISNENIKVISLQGIANPEDYDSHLYLLLYEFNKQKISKKTPLIFNLNQKGI